MAKAQKQMASSVRVIVTTLVIAFIMIGILLVTTMNKGGLTDFRSQATLANALKACTSSCTNPAYKDFIKDSGKCALDCTKVTSGEMNCGDFCSANLQGGGAAFCSRQCQTWQQRATSPFNDVPADHWAAQHIARVYKARITAGCATNPLRFCPDKPASRAEVITLIMKGKYNTTFSRSGPRIFADVPDTNPFLGYIEKAYQDGVTAGCATDPLRFCPDSPSPRGEVARMFVNLKHGKNFTPPAYAGTFSDVPQSHPNALVIEQFERDNPGVGCSENPRKFCPDRPINRAELAVFLSKVFNLQ